MRSISKLAAGLLQQVIDGFDNAGVELPPVQYVAPGSQVAFDGPQITVNLTHIGYGAPGAELGVPIPHVEAFFGNFQVAIIRDCPGLDEDGNAPDPDALNAAAMTNLDDVKTLTEVLVDIRNRCTPGAGGLVDASWLFAASEAVPVGPEGNVAAAVATVQISLL